MMERKPRKAELDDLEIGRQNLDDEEKRIDHDLSAGKYRPDIKSAANLGRFRKAAKKMLTKKPITVRVNEDDIARIKLIAQKTGIPYQTLVSSIIHRYVTGQLKGDA